jgi:hypothetical protein
MVRKAEGLGIAHFKRRGNVAADGAARSKGVVAIIDGLRLQPGAQAEDAAWFIGFVDEAKEEAGLGGSKVRHLLAGHRFP